jgi:hypothetical protein
MCGAYVITVGAPMYLEGSSDNHSDVLSAASQVTEEIRMLAARSEERMKQRRISWKSFITFQNFISILSE